MKTTLSTTLTPNEFRERFRSIVPAEHDRDAPKDINGDSYYGRCSETGFSLILSQQKPSGPIRFHTSGTISKTDEGCEITIRPKRNDFSNLYRRIVFGVAIIFVILMFLLQETKLAISAFAVTTLLFWAGIKTEQKIPNKLYNKLDTIIDKTIGTTEQNHTNETETQQTKETL